MKEKKYTRNMEKLRRNQGCLTDCVAYFLNLHPEKVPYFVYPRKGWNDRLKAFFRRHGYKVHWQYCEFKPSTKKVHKSWLLPKHGTHIVCGNSLKWKTYAHVVVYKNSKLIYDPNYPSDWKDERITHRLIIKEASTPQ